MLPVCLAVLLAAEPTPPTWPQWRGPNRDGTVKGEWPASVGEAALKPVWTAPDLGPSYSGPIVSADAVFTTQTVDKTREVVTAHDRATGKLKWKQEWDGTLTVPFFAAKNGSWIRSTPALGGDTLYVAGIRDVLVALDAKTGAVKWRLDFVAELKTPPPDFGTVCSPLADDTGVYMQAGAGVAKVEMATGKILWRALTDGGGMMGSAFASPTFAPVAGKRQLLVQTRTKLAGLDPATGAVAWEKEIPSFRGMNILTPVPVGDGVFTSTYGGTTQLVKLKADGDVLKPGDGWSLKYEGNMSTPVVVAGHAYLLGKDRRLVCVDLASGKQTWRSEQTFGDYWSLVTNGDKILGLDQKGTLYLIQADPKELKVLDQRKVGPEAWAHLAVAGDEVVIRDLNALTLYKWK